ADTVSITASVSAGKTPPTLSNLRLSKSSLPVPRVHEQFFLTLTFDFEDPDGDLDQLQVTFTGPQGTLRSATESFHSAEAKGTYSDDLRIDSSYTAGLYQLSYELKDRQGQGSGVQTASFTLEEAAERPLEITGISPESGKSGDSIVITGKGFEETSSANRISFRGSIGSAEILSATTDRIEVIVPQGAMTGPVGLMTSSGRTESQSPFTVDPTITISPVITRMVTDQTVDFSCMVSGIDSPRLEWSVNHQATPDLSLGTIDATGNYRSPQTVPPANPVTIRCASADDPAVYAELQVEIIPLVPPPGEGTTVQAATGGEIESAKGEVRVVIPQNVLTSDTVITVEHLTPDALPSASEDSINLAAARLSPPGLQFSQPVTVIFTLRNWEEPGSGLPLFLLDETTGSLVDTGKMVLVDDTGLKATGEVDHFSTYIVARTLSVNELSMANTFTTLSPLFTEFYIETPPEISFLEGLSVPVLIRRQGGPGSGVGPFARGVTITPVLSGYTQSNTPLSAGPLVQPSADGWQLGTVINIPTLTNCGEGQTIGATLVIGYQQSVLSKTMKIPFTIECLPELNFSGVSPLNPIPEGVEVINPTLVSVRTGRTYRFSEITIGQGGILSVVSETADPAVIEVTGDVSVYGEISTSGSNGYKGGDGEGADEGGAGGYQGYAYGGRGGKGGPSTTNERDGQDAFYGGGGGEHGLKWDAGSVLKLDYQLLLTAYDLYFQNYVAAIQDAYGVYAEYIKIDSNPENARLSSGGGGAGGHSIWVWDAEFGMWELPIFAPPGAGGGGGGGGKMVISMEFDNAGGGGGGGGGAASSLKLVVGGVLYLDAGARVNGKGGDGGNGGNGSSTWPNQAAGGGGAAVAVAHKLFSLLMR
ncbi:MAG: IPT/TIG domain-containing protein, partial [Planctomycetes bacterium]|nr:IPT/TIG domain-containing protein [Planctomycetota bacterium]